MDQYDLQGYQPIRSFARTECDRRSGGVAFYFENSVKNKPLNFDNKLECSLFEVQLDDFKTMNFCLIYRLDSVKLNYFFEELENILFYLRSQRADTLIISDFNIDTLEESGEKNNMRMFWLHMILIFRIHCRR